MCHSGKITEICIRRLPTFCGESSSHFLFWNLFSALELTSPTFCISCLECVSLCPFWWNVMSCPLTFSISQPRHQKAFPLFTVTQTSLSWSRMSGCLPLSRENVFLSPLPLWFWVCGLESYVRANSKGTRNQKRWKHSLQGSSEQVAAFSVPSYSWNVLILLCFSNLLVRQGLVPSLSCRAYGRSCMDPARLKFLRAKSTHLVLSSLPQHLALYLEIGRHEKIHAEWVDGFGWMNGLEVVCPSQATVNRYKHQKGKESLLSKHTLSIPHA